MHRSRVYALLIDTPADEAAQAALFRAAARPARSGRAPGVRGARGERSEGVRGRGRHLAVT
ncbi:hypothetical protein [Nonomuraea basaltis]|uniref:hypothetical protein n=1 Tax=Nonomuraea basaltis TaxID=2495887 RepID=UPI00148722FC|nr:hypothetical protein [Nonomuraea basaltis]